MSVEAVQDQANVSRNGAGALGGPIEADKNGTGVGGITSPNGGAQQARGNDGEVVPVQIERSGSDTSRVEIGSDARLQEALDEGQVELDLGNDYKMTLERTDSGQTQATLQTPEDKQVTANAVAKENGDLTVDVSVALNDQWSVEAKMDNSQIDAGMAYESGDFKGSLTRESDGNAVLAGSINGPNAEANAELRFGEDTTTAELDGSFKLVDDKNVEITLSGDVQIADELKAGGELDVQLGDNVQATIFANSDGVLKANVEGEIKDVSVEAGYDSTTGTANAQISVEVSEDITVTGGVDAGSPYGNVEAQVAENMTVEGGYNNERGSYAEVEGEVRF